MSGRALALAAMLACWPALAGPAWVSPGPAVPSVSLVDQDGRSLRLDALLRDRPVAVSFFFTGCATVCPTQTALLRDVRDELDRRGHGGPRGPLLLSVSVDPLSDRPEQLRRYAERFELRLGAEQGWVMLTGSMPALQRVWAAFDASPGGPAEHIAMLWIGHPQAQRWSRQSAFASPAAIADLLLQDPR